MKDRNNIEIRIYDWKLAALQTKKILRQMISMSDKADKGMVTFEDVSNLCGSFNFLIDIIHLMDPEEDTDGKDIELINLYRPDKRQKGGK